MRIVTAPEMAELDRKTIEEIGIPGIVLMENAGRGAAAFFQQVFPDILDHKITVVAGSGNNGGDGFVLARLFWEKGARVQVVCLRSPHRLRGDALTNFKILERLGIPCTVHNEEENFESQTKWIHESDIIIDAILGTGLTSEVRGLYRKVIDAINESSVPVLAVDVPSGLDASSGRILGTAIRAKATATFGLAKVGQLVAPGEEYVGQLQVVDIGIPPTVVESSGIERYWLDERLLAEWLTPRSPSIHKGNAGHVGVLSGSTGKTGAATLICEGAARVGAGLVTLFIPSSLNAIVEVKLTEMMTLPIAETAEHSPSKAAAPVILQFLSGKQAFGLGPGISLHPETQDLVLSILPEIDCPMVLDADALTIIANHLEMLKNVKAPMVFTPHPGEMAKLIGGTTHQVQANRLEVAAEFSREHGVTLVLKGHRTIIAAPDGKLAINGSGNPAMASGGMGDTLTGMIAGFLGQGFGPFEAACLGVYIHGAAADRRIGKIATRGLLASDLLDEIPQVIGRLERLNKSDNA